MSTTKTKKTKTPNSPATQNPDATTPAENQETQVSGKSAKSGKMENSPPGVRIVSVGFPSKTARQLKLLASVSGESIASIVIGAVSRVIAKKLPDALAELAKTDGDAEPE